MYSSNNGTGIRPWATELAFWIPHALPHWLAAHRPQTSPPLFSYGCKRNNKKSSYDIKSGVDVRAHWLTDTVMKHALLGVGISGSHISLTWSIHVLQSCWMRNWNWFLKDVIKIQAMTSAAPVFRYNYRNVIQTKAGANNPQQKTTRPHCVALPLAIFVREGNFNFFFPNIHNNFSLCFTVSSILCHDKLIKKQINF